MPHPSLVSMRLDGHDDFDVLDEVDRRPQYPPGLVIRLNEQTLRKLGIPPNQPQVNQMTRVIALARVSSVSAEDKTIGQERSVELQITELSVVPVGGVDPGPVLFPHQSET